MTADTLFEQRRREPNPHTLGAWKNRVVASKLLTANSVLDRRLVATRSDSYRLGRIYVALLLITTLDITNYLDTGSSARYVIVLLPFWTIFLARLRRPSTFIRRPSMNDGWLLALFLIGLAGSVYGKAQLGTTSTALPVFIPMSIAFVYLFTLDEPTDEEAWRLLKAIAIIGLAYAVLNALANAQVIGLLRANRNYRNSMSMFAALAFASTFVIGRRRWMVGLLFLFGVAFVFYPSATFALVALTTLVTFFVTRPVASASRAYLVGIVTLFAVLIGLLNFSKTVALTNVYFASVGKANDNTARIDLWTAGIRKWEQSPFIGDAFSGNTTTSVERRAYGGSVFEAPYHNDYVMFLSSGGLLGLGLLLAWIAGTETGALRRYRGFVAAGEPGKANLLRAVLCAFNAWLVAAAFNPLFTGASRSLTLFSFYGLMMLVGTPGAAVEPIGEPFGHAPGA